MWSATSYSDWSCFVQSIILWKWICKFKPREPWRAWQQSVFILCPERDTVTQTEWDRSLSSLCQSPSFQSFPGNSVISYIGQVVNLSPAARYLLPSRRCLLQMRKLLGVLYRGGGIEMTCAKVEHAISLLRIMFSDYNSEGKCVKASISWL